LRHLDLDTATAAVRVGGTILVTAGWGARPQLPVSALYTRDAALRGFVISRARASDLAAAARAINRFVGSGALTAHAVEEPPLAETAQAHRRIESGDLRGRLVLRP
jgi:NADPH:quinone reductase-like Zn-dependent oxidoreductase